MNKIEWDAEQSCWFCGNQAQGDLSFYVERIGVNYDCEGRVCGACSMRNKKESTSVWRKFVCEWYLQHGKQD